MIGKRRFTTVMTGIIGAMIADVAIQIVSIIKNAGQTSIGLSMAVCGLVSTIVVGYAVTMAYQKTKGGGDS